MNEFGCSISPITAKRANSVNTSSPLVWQCKISSCEVWRLSTSWNWQEMADFLGCMRGSMQGRAEGWPIYSCDLYRKIEEESSYKLWWAPSSMHLKEPITYVITASWDSLEHSITKKTFFHQPFPCCSGKILKKSWFVWSYATNWQ